MSPSAYSELTEAQWRDTVVELAETYGWRCYYVEQSTREITRRSGARIRVRNINPRGQGFPDLVMVRRRDARLIFAELKRDKGPRGGTEARHVEPTEEQKAWLDDLEHVARAVDTVVEDGPTPAAVCPSVEVHVWRPADYDAIERTLR